MKKESYYELMQDSRKENKIIHSLGYTCYPSHFHKKTEITYIKSGNCSSVINQTEYFAEKDDILYVPAYYPHSYKTSESAKRILLTPTHEYTSDIENLCGKKTFPCLLSDKQFNHDKVLPILNDMLKVQLDQNIEDNAKTLIIKGFANAFYGRIYERYSANMVEHIKQVETITNVLMYLEENYKHEISLDELANKFGYNKYYFSKFFNATVGDNLKNYINTIRVKKFVKLFKENSSDNITNIAFSLGFDSMPSFYRAFKRFYHCSPKEYFTQPHGIDK